MACDGALFGAIERGYQRGKIREESHYYESLKSSGEYPIIGVNTFPNPEADHEAEMDQRELHRGTDSPLG
jgi:methylmalonyl-CoA mutase